MKMLRLPFRRASQNHHFLPVSLHHRATLVNVKLKWVKDRPLDRAVARDRFLRPIVELLHRISDDRRRCVPSDDLSHLVRLLAVPRPGVASLLRRYPTLFAESPRLSFSLTDRALLARQSEIETLRSTEPDLVSRLRRLLMLTSPRSLPLPTIEQLRWDLGLPHDYLSSIIPRYPEHFELCKPEGDERFWLKIVSWDPGLAVSELQRSANGLSEECLAFPIRFPRGFGLKKKCKEWLREWQTLPYTSPYVDPSDLDPRTDLSEKRNVGVFHELLHLTIGKKTERKNFSNLRVPLCLPQKFTKVFERHPGIFYVSMKMATQTVVLREAYGGGGDELIMKHPLVVIRERYVAMMMEDVLEGRRKEERKKKKKKKEETAGDDCDNEGSEEEIFELEHQF